MLVSDEKLRGLAGLILLVLACIELFLKVQNGMIENIMMMLAGFLVAGALLKKSN